jgi:hypothetical protein
MFEQRELLVVSSLMDEKAHRINKLINDLEIMTELASFNITKHIENGLTSTKKMYTASDFKNLELLKETLVTNFKYDVPVSYEYPDILLRNKTLYKKYSYLYWETKEIFSQLYKLYPYVLWTYVGFNIDGSFINYPGTYSEPAEYDPRERPWYTVAKNSSTPVWTKPYYDSGQGSTVITVSKSIIDPRTNKLCAVTGTDILLKNFVKDIITLDQQYDMDLVIVDENDQILYRKGNESIYGDWKDAPNRLLAKKYIGSKGYKEFLKTSEN